MKRGHSRKFAAALLLISMPFAAQGQSDVMDELRKCNEIAATEERLACYDRINKPEPAPEPKPEPVAEPAVAPAAAATPVPDDSPAQVPQQTVDAAQGSESVEEFGLPKEEDDFPAISARVVKCGEANDRRFYFYLENGQAWRYLGNRHLRYRNCDYAATLREDSLGFKLYMEGEPGLRVKRVR